MAHLRCPHSALEQRGLWDHNKTLWTGWVLENPEFRVFFVGDTGYSNDFLKLGRQLKDFELAAIPIGAYEPR